MVVSSTTASFILGHSSLVGSEIQFVGDMAYEYSRDAQCSNGQKIDSKRCMHMCTFEKL